MTEKTFGEEADKFLKEFYEKYGSTTTQQKVELLKLVIGGQFNFYAMGGPVTDEMMLGCLEYELLDREGKITLVLA